LSSNSSFFKKRCIFLTRKGEFSFSKIFDNHEYEIVNDRRKKVKTIDEIEAMRGKNKNNMELK